MAWLAVAVFTVVVGLAAGWLLEGGAAMTLSIPARTRPWYWDRREVARLAAWLVAEDGAGVDVLLRLIDEPWHFELHRNRMIRDQARGAAA